MRVAFALTWCLAGATTLLPLLAVALWLIGGFVAFMGLYAISVQPLGGLVILIIGLVGWRGAYWLDDHWMDIHLYFDRELRKF